MITDWAAVVWKKLPWRARRLVVRATQPSFTVSVAAVIANPRGEVLLLDHRIRPRSGWGVPGGFLESGEQPSAGLRREIREETGLELTELRLMRARTVGGHLEILFTAKADGEPRLQGDEIKGFGWFPPGRFPAGLNPDQKRSIERVLDGEFEKCPTAD